MATRERHGPNDPGIDLAFIEPRPGDTQEQTDRFNETWSAPPGLMGKLRTINNIPVARRYMIAGFLFFLIGGVQALLLRIQLGSPENTFLDPETYNQIFTMHGTTMMFLFVIPFIEAIANYVLPLLLGTRDLPFPRLTALAFWTYVLGGIFLYASFLFGVAPNGGWFAYVPLTGKDFSPAINMDWWDIGLSVAELAAMGAAAEIIVAILRMRAAGMSLARMPVFAWSMLVTAFMIIFAFTPLIVATALLELDRKGLTSFFDVAAGGDPLLWQHLFWIFGHPDVYIMFVPAIGIVSHIVQTFSRRPLVGYPFIILGIISIGFLSFGLWVHHMFTTGIPPAAMGFFTAASMMIAIPSGVQVFCWIATIWTGRPVWRTPLLFVAGFIAIFTLGGLTGVMTASVPFDAQVHDSYFVVAHFHYVMVGGVVFPLIAGLYYWLPKITGHLLSERLGRWNFWVMFVFFNVAFFPMHISGMLGMPRRVYTYPPGLGWEVPNLISTIGALGFGAGVLLFVINFFWSLRRGEDAGMDPWGGDSLEWAQESPPADAQFQSLPVVRSRNPLWDQDSLWAETPAVRRVVDALSWRPLDFRGALVVSMVEARPLAIVHVPGPTIWPFVMSVAFVFIFSGALFDSLIAFLIGAGITLVSLVGWFSPDESHDAALEEFSTSPDADPAPLAVAGPMANGWWGTIVFLMIMATALACTVASFFYLGGHDAGAPAAGSWSAALGAFAGVGAAIAMLLAGGARPAQDARYSRVWLLVTLALNVVAFWLFLDAYRATGATPATSAADSAVLVSVGFQWTMQVLLAAMLVPALLWAFRRASDPRGAGAAANAALVAYSTAASGALLFLTLYVVPALW